MEITSCENTSHCIIFKCFLYICKAVPRSYPSVSIGSTNKGYEGETMKFSCHLRTRGDPPVTWSWFCGQEQIKSHITYKDNDTYVTFPLSRKYHQKACYCRATSPSSILDYNRTSTSEYSLYLYRE